MRASAPRRCWGFDRGIRAWDRNSDVVADSVLVRPAKFARPTLISSWDGRHVRHTAGPEVNRPLESQLRVLRERQRLAAHTLLPRSQRSLASEHIARSVSESPLPDDAQSNESGFPSPRVRGGALLATDQRLTVTVKTPRSTYHRISARISLTPRPSLRRSNVRNVAESA